jgi:hypothetical protein
MSHPGGGRRRARAGQRRPWRPSVPPARAGGA